MTTTTTDLMSLKLLQAFREDPRLFIEQFCFIRDKQRHTVPLRFNFAQADYYQYRTRRDMILKPRQMGFTTGVCGLFFADTLLHHNTHSVIVAHNTESAQTIFEIVAFMWKHVPKWWHEHHPPGRANAGELYWPSLESRFYVGTAGSLNFGRGQTINNLLCSEIAHWRKAQEALTALLAAVPDAGRIVLESTPNGVGTVFYDMWQQAMRDEGRFAAHFYLWWEDPGYRLPGPPLGELSLEERDLRARHKLDDDQLRWRREKMRELREKFKQEFAEDSQSCFLANGACCFSTDALMQQRARAVQQRPRQIETPIPYFRYCYGKKEEGLANPLPGRLTIWRERDPEHGYVIGADVASGLESGNCSAAVVLDWNTKEQVAELHGRWRPDVFARLLSGLAAIYGQPKLAVESNNHGLTALHVLRHELHYPWLYHHVDRLRPDKPELGWPTNSRTKPTMIDQFAAAIAEGRIVMRSPWLIDECLTFVDRDGHLGAEEGKLDDLVIAAAIAWSVAQRPMARGFAAKPPGW